MPTTTPVTITPTLAREVGFTVPVTLTPAAWEAAVAWTDADTEETGAYQDETGRLWDVLSMFRWQAKARGGSGPMYFKLYFIMKERQRRLVTLKALAGPGDQGEPVITILLPEED